MRKVLSYKIFEAIYIGKINLSDYEFVYDYITMSGWFKMTHKESGEQFSVEIKSNGKVPKDGKINEMRVFSPSNKDFDLESLVDKIVYISNKNRLGYKFTKKEVVDPKYGLQPYGIISVSPNLKMDDYERVISSTKPINNMVKKDGDLDQFTF